MNEIKFIYFDVGGVVIKDFSKTNKWLELQQELGIPFERSQEFKDFFKQYEPEVCKGREVDTILPMIVSHFNIKIPKNYSFLIDGFVNRYEKNFSIWPIIKKLKNQFKVGLLTNMYPGLLRAIKDKGLLPDVNWNVIVDSTVEKTKKPEIKIYKVAEFKAQCKPHEILFVENGAKNIEAAKNLGWQTFLYDPANPDESNKKLLSLFSLQI